MIRDTIILIQFILLFIGVLFLWKYVPVEIAINQIKDREYREGYKCLDFSEDLTKEFEKRGVQSHIVIGENQETAKEEEFMHAWVGIWIEPQTGEFTNGNILPEKHFILKD